MSTPARPFDAAFVHNNWYTRSLSEQLSNLNRKFQAKFPPEFAVIFADAATSVYAHESRMHQYLKTTPPHEPIHPDTYFVYNGYQKALQPLMDAMEAEVYVRNPTVRGFRDSLLPDLRVRLIGWAAESISRVYYYGSGAV
ncbi:hypothetical protein BDV93DRAFT_508902 [Ceratobasidium sp. AG-I]|nr:hypothetical protein BDV93DRAFT_508902 [Ceratobasidium sp. AG-I]